MMNATLQISSQSARLLYLRWQEAFNSRGFCLDQIRRILFFSTKRVCTADRDSFCYSNYLEVSAANVRVDSGQPNEDGKAEEA